METLVQMAKRLGLRPNPSMTGNDYKKIKDLMIQELKKIGKTSSDTLDGIMYDFHKKKTNSDVHTFQHNKFKKGQKELIKTILRKRKKDKNKIINTLIPLNMELVKYNNNYDINNYKNKIDGR